VDSGDEFVLHVDHGIRGFGSRGVQETEHDRVPLRCREPAQAPHVIAADLCAQDPEQAARMLVARQSTPRFDYALQAMQEIPYNRWREYDPEDTVRFYALRLQEAGMIKSSPQKLIAQGTDWRFFNELKKELK
jgi:hypothetical protein